MDTHIENTDNWGLLQCQPILASSRCFDRYNHNRLDPRTTRHQPYCGSSAVDPPSTPTHTYNSYSISPLDLQLQTPTHLNHTHGLSDDLESTYSLSNNEPLKPSTPGDHSLYFDLNSDSGSDFESDLNITLESRRNESPNSLQGVLINDNIASTSPDGQAASNPPVLKAEILDPIDTNGSTQQLLSPINIEAPLLVDTPPLAKKKAKKGKLPNRIATDNKCTSGRQQLLANKAKMGRPRKAHVSSKIENSKYANPSTANTPSPTDTKTNRISSKKFKTAPPKVKKTIRQCTPSCDTIKTTSVSVKKDSSIRDTINSSHPQPKSKQDLIPSSDALTTTARCKPKLIDVKPSPKRNTRAIPSRSSKHLSPIACSPPSSSMATNDDYEYQPSPTPSSSLEREEMEALFEKSRPPPKSAKKINLLKRIKEEDEDWEVYSRKKRSVSSSSATDDRPPPINKARGIPYHAGRQEQNVRAQSKYRNKVKARSDKMLCYLRRLFFAFEGKTSTLKTLKYRCEGLKKEFLKEMKDLDEPFVNQKFREFISKDEHDE
ncbi:uncharacterized protein L201_006745 [Kwoniella dendrophila CBS 6074]|uniref:BZIP domain-containing protein n=1 Tax=Kwoniella dendrophila CBS 6074 TaxID=1295534 RepID=A0AAX4K4Y7_9TREE